MPKDPWGISYKIDPMYGALIGAGPNNVINTVAADEKARVAAADDLMVFWKPPFFISKARAITSCTVELEFSRPLDSATLAATDFTVAGNAGIAYQLVAPTILRMSLAAADAMVVSTATTVTMPVAPASIAGLDGRVMTLLDFDLRPDQTAGNSIAFTTQATF
jgi:hypothetical protein